MSTEEIVAIQKKLEEYEQRIVKLEQLLWKDNETTLKHISVKEFLLSKKPNGDVQKTLAMGYYLEKYQNYTCFNGKDIESGFRAAKEPPPENINDKINQNIRKGQIMNSEEKKDGHASWVLTHTGERFVENNFKKMKE